MLSHCARCDRLCNAARYPRAPLVADRRLLEKVPPMAKSHMPVLFQEFSNPKKRALLARIAQTGRLTVRGHPDDWRNHYYWLRDDPAYKAAYQEARQIAGDNLEREAFKRALASSDLLLIFLLKGAFPDKYKERHQIEHKGAVDLLHKLQQIPTMSDAELDDLAAEVEQYARRN